MELGGLPLRMQVRGETIHASTVLPRFYEMRTYQPAWTDGGRPLDQAVELVAAVKSVETDGMKPAHYHMALLESLLKEAISRSEAKDPPDPTLSADLDILCTDAFLLCASHLLAGRVDPASFDAQWHANRRGVDLAAALKNALDSNRVGKVLEELVPPYKGYRGIKKALSDYRSIAIKGGWVAVPAGPSIKKGQSGERIALLRSRLAAEGFINQNVDIVENTFDEPLESAVITFQQRHGLDPDGVVGPATLAELNVPARDRARQIEINLERWRWLPQDLGQRHIIINIAAFELDVVENENTALNMRIVVGKEYRRTPVFSDTMRYLVLSPYWNVPPSIAKKDKLPLIQKDPNYLEQQHMHVFPGWGANGREVDPKTINWSSITANGLSYRFRQDPGPWNALGGIKFMFPNKYNVYLHDTPSKELFNKTKRTFSSGCIRIQKPLELAEYLLRGDQTWTREKIMAAIEKRVEQTVRLPAPISVHLLYWTVAANEDGSLSFYKDIYGRDTLLDEALRNASS